ncbi:cupin domain-containing protein [Microbacterium sp. RD1]|uniref:cupin domain-containing protein n=1 Tax=Microbacterium sp. RD1 TaxID=3457313 RepID=UPI003FA53A35
MKIAHPHPVRNAPGKASQFTGSALGDSILPAADGVIINQVTFEPGARTHWHTHEHGQILFVVAGYGLICPDGEAPSRLAPGDWVWIPAGERHWHGAAPDSFLTHTAISLGTTSWSDEVTAEEYSSQPHPEGEPS